ncbi:CHAP domain-containing protein [Dyella caseinilytica]|uniref:CHAP domain-containing protein n=1 Tax=Dyella caseinilytica TaxID=1849581 RepID=A0ABX7H275_9GAMM|nr:CHAP domain-containing protein [Dyella caseinilytica]
MACSGSSAASFADSHVESKSLGKCATYVRRAIEWGGVSLGRTPSATDMGLALQAAGFYEINGSPQKGDVVVIQPAPGHTDGHVAIYDGQHWISDFKQLHGLYPGPSYRNSQPSYKIYRHD